MYIFSQYVVCASFWSHELNSWGYKLALQKGSYLYLHIEFEKYEQKVDLGGGILLYNLPQKVNQNRQKHLLNKSQAANQGIFLGHSKAL